MLCLESEPQVRAIEDVPLVVPETPEEDWPTAAKLSSHHRLGNSMIHECRRALFNGDTLASNKLAMEKGEDDQTVKNVKKVTAAQEMSISDMETDDENEALADPAAVEDVVAPVPLVEQEAMEAMAPAPLEEQDATELVPREFILSNSFRSNGCTLMLAPPWSSPSSHTTTRYINQCKNNRCLGHIQRMNIEVGFYLFFMI